MATKHTESDVDVEALTREDCWITRGNGGTGRRIHIDRGCPSLNQGGQNAAKPRHATTQEIEQMRRGERKLCSRECCGDFEGSKDGYANDRPSAWDIRRMAKNGEIE